MQGDKEYQRSRAGRWQKGKAYGWLSVILVVGLLTSRLMLPVLAAENPAVFVDTEAGTENLSGTDAKPVFMTNVPEKGNRANDDYNVKKYAIIAAIAGLTYILLYFAEDKHGMTEREKKAYVSAFVRWAKKGGIFRKCCALAVVSCILAYYHSVGKIKN